MGDTGEAETIGQRILDAIREPLNVEGRSVTVSASLGIAFYPDDGLDAESLQREADAAMYCAKGLGGTAFRYSAPAMRRSIKSVSNTS